jgi:hypothetical protein
LSRIRPGARVWVQHNLDVEIAVGGQRQRDADEPLAEQEAIRRSPLVDRRDRRVRAVRPVVQTEQRIGAVGRVEDRLDLRWRDGHCRRRLVAVDARAPVGSQALKERIVLVYRRAVDGHDPGRAVGVREGVACQRGFVDDRVAVLHLATADRSDRGELQQQQGT